MSSTVDTPPQLKQHSPATGGSLTIQMLNDVDALRHVSTEWEQLWWQTPDVSAFQALDWILACAVHGSGSGIHAMMLRGGGEPLAIFPTRLSGRGRLSFIGAELSNYCGPVYAPAALPSVMTAWREAVSADPQIRSIDLTGLRGDSPFLRVLAQSVFPRWGKPEVVETNTCPEVDLHEGWETAFRKHKSRQRANWRRKWDSLADLGRLEFRETGDPDELAAAFPRLFELYDARWGGKHVRGAFGPEQRGLQLEAAKAMSTHGLVRLSLIRLDGEIVAFAYSMRGATESTSYVLAHDAAFEVFSPGLLLLIKILEDASARGDTCYDFSLGEAPYKAMWATGEQRVFSVLLGRGTTLAAMKRRCWTSARSIPLLRSLKQEGVQRFTIWKSHRKIFADQPGIAAGTAAMWHVYGTPAAPQSPPEPLYRPLRYSEMRALFSPRLLALALDRHYRGDRALALERDGRVVAAIWRAALHRRSIVTGGYMSAGDSRSVYYHPVVVPGEDTQKVAASLASEESVVVSTRPLATERVKERHTFRGDLWFRL